MPDPAPDELQPAGEPPSTADSPPAAPPPPRVPEAVRRRVATCSLAGVLALTGLAFAAALLGPWAPAVGLAILIGHAAAQAVTLSWLVGAVSSFDADSGTFLGSTLGLAPFRLLGVVVVLTLAAALGGLDPVPLFASFLVTHLAGQGIEVWAFSALGAAAAPDRPDGGDQAPER